MKNNDLKFLADEMLGRLTRWLRILGSDVLYLNASDDELLLITEKEKRTLLTRDITLFKKAAKHNITAYLVQGNTCIERLVDIRKNFCIELQIDTTISRCPSCNFLIQPVEKSNISDRVHLGTLNNYDSFWECSNCGKVYWQGGHWKNIQQVLVKVKKITNRCVLIDNKINIDS